MPKAMFTAALLLAVLALMLGNGSQRETAEAGNGCTASALCVNTTADHVFDGCDAAPGDCTLRDALGDSSALDAIQFDIPGAGVRTINIDAGLGRLTLIENSVSINGYTQPGASANSVLNTSTELKPGNASIRIVLNGSGTVDTGIWVKGSDALIQGLSFVNFQEEGIFVSTLSTSASIQGNYIGVLPDGQTPGPNGIGVSIRSSEGGNLVGGSLPSQRNVISGNTGPGVSVTGSVAVSIAGNFIGTNADGTAPVPNDVGISMAGGTFSTIGGNGTGPANLISGNAHDAIVLSTPDGAHMNIKGNRIGVQGDGTTPLPNGGAGVLLEQGAFDNTIGGEFNAGEHNVIAYNGGAGVALTVSAGVDNYIDPNDMYSNVGLGADFLNDGLPLANDAGDGDGGNDGGSEHTNRLMNYPVIDSASYNSPTLTVNFTLDTVPGQYYNMFFFWNEECDPSGFGEGQHFLGSLGVNSNAPMPDHDSQEITKPLAGTVYLVMSASDPESSSEFSPCYALDISTPTPTPTPTLTATPTPTPSPTPTPIPSGEVTPSPTAPPAPKQGDTNCDEQITLGDVTQFLGFLASGERGPAPDGCPDPGNVVGQGVIKFLDMNCDESLTPFDALIELISIAGANGPQIPGSCAFVGERIFLS